MSPKPDILFCEIVLTCIFETGSYDENAFFVKKDYNSVRQEFLSEYYIAKHVVA